MKIYEVVISFLDPARGVITVQAETEEEAVNAVRARLDGQVKDLVIEAVKLAAEDKTEGTAINTNRIVN